MQKTVPIFTAILLLASGWLYAQVEPAAGSWKTWFISSGKDYRLPAPPSYKNEIAQVISAQQNMNAAGWQQLQYWAAGAPGYHWVNLVSKLWPTDTSNNGALANMLVNVAIYDATIAAWETKYAYKRLRPFAADKRISAYAPKPESPSYPCEYSVAAGAALTIIAHYYPHLRDSVNHMAERLMSSRIAAGMAFPSDTRAGFELGATIARIEIERTKDFTCKTAWDGQRPQGPGLWNGKRPMLPLAGRSRTVALDSSSQFRPAPPPDFAKEMAEMKSYKQTFGSRVNAFFWASQPFWFDELDKKIFEYNLQLNAPRSARLYALTAIGAYDCFTACWDAKYAYWGIRPDQYDTTWRPLLPTPPFPGYPSGHAALGSTVAELYASFFPAEKAYFLKKAKEAAESRFQAGIHFRTDNEVALELGRKVAAVIIEKAQHDGAGLSAFDKPLP